MKPSVGRIVHYRNNSGSVLAAIICYVHSERIVNLAVFTVKGEAEHQTSVDYSETGVNCTWSWPPRV